MKLQISKKLNEARQIFYEKILKHFKTIIPYTKEENLIKNVKKGVHKVLIAYTLHLITFYEIISIDSFISST